MSTFSDWLDNEFNNWNNLAGFTLQVHGIDSKEYIHANGQKEAYERCRMAYNDLERINSDGNV